MAQIKAEHLKDSDAENDGGIKIVAENANVAGNANARNDRLMRDSQAEGDLAEQQMQQQVLGFELACRADKLVRLE